MVKRRPPRAGNPVWTLILREMEWGPTDAHELQTVVGISLNKVREYLTEMHKKKIIRVSEWVRTVSLPYPVYGLASTHPDKPRPQPYTKSERQHRNRHGESLKVPTRRPVRTNPVDTGIGGVLY